MTQQANIDFDINAAIAAEAETSADQNIATKGGSGGYTPPAAGLVRLRLVGYFELGKKDDTYEGKPKVTDEVQLTFELSGPKHAPKKLDDGRVIPQRLNVYLHKSMHEKAGYFKLFKAMNWDGKAKIMAQLLGQDFLGTIHHKKWKSDPSKVTAQLKDPVSGAFTVRLPFVEDAETGESRRVTVDAAITPIKAFLWNNPSKAMWASIFIEGEYEEVKNDDGSVKYPAKSKNVVQNRIREATNFEGSAIAELLSSGSLDIQADKPAPTNAAEKAAVQAMQAARVPAPAARVNPIPPADEGDDPLAAF